MLHKIQNNNRSGEPNNRSSFYMILLGPPKVSKGRSRFYETVTAPLKPLEEHFGVLAKEQVLHLRIL